ncbi:MAG: hypothetical protein HY275_15270, partial [Gemmatimonadetes bacterium]|nr:hypothetical protein [Gemmatimonadota bacterium]
MSPVDRLRAVQREVTLAVLADAVVRAMLLVALTWVVAALTDRLVTLPLALRQWLPWALALAALALALWRARRALPLRDARAAALWVERQAPELRYALVTRLDPAGAPVRDVLDRAIARVAFEGPARRAAWTPLVRPGLAL